jgi:osmoprotectant transport system permease protein
VTAAVADTAERASLLRLRLRNPVLLLLLVIGAAAVIGCGFVTLAPNRLVSGRPVMLWEVGSAALMVAIAALAALSFISVFVTAQRLVNRAAALIAATLLLTTLAAAGSAAAQLAAGTPALARVSLGAGFWVLFAVSALALIDAMQRVEIGGPAKLAVVAALAAACVGMAEAGAFDALSLALEYRNRRAEFAAALGRHALLVAAAIGPALLVGFPLGVAALRRPGLQSPVFAVLNLLQTIPSIALFGLLLAPLAALAAAAPLLAAFGIGGIGPAPAIIALITYALLPVVRSTVAAFGSVDAAVIDAGRGMGMTPRQLFWQAELPLAAPVLLAGLRIITVQAIGLAVVAALIGAGGLGTFVFQGLGQYAGDLILLGALPTIALALAADFLLQILAPTTSRRARP